MRMTVSPPQFHLLLPDDVELVDFTDATEGDVNVGGTDVSVGGKMNDCGINSGRTIDSPERLPAERPAERPAESPAESPPESPVIPAAATWPWIICCSCSGVGKMPCISICWGNAGCTRAPRSMGRPPMVGRAPAAAATEALRPGTLELATEALRPGTLELAIEALRPGILELDSTDSCF